MPAKRQWLKFKANLRTPRVLTVGVRQILGLIKTKLPDEKETASEKTKSVG